MYITLGVLKGKEEAKAEFVAAVAQGKKVRLSK